MRILAAAVAAVRSDYYVAFSLLKLYFSILMCMNKKRSVKLRILQGSSCDKDVELSRA